MAKQMPPAKRGKGRGDSKESKGVQYVRGGSICNPKDKSGHLIRGSGKPAVCRTTAGKDPRPRYRQAGG